MVVDPAGGDRSGATGYGGVASVAIAVAASVAGVVICRRGRESHRHGRAVRVSSRGELSAPPSCLAMGHGPPIEVGQWAGPWPCDEKWWDPLHGRRRARLQVVSADGIAYLSVLEAGEWTQAALWD